MRVLGLALETPMSHTSRPTEGKGNGGRDTGEMLPAKGVGMMPAEPVSVVNWIVPTAVKAEGTVADGIAVEAALVLACEGGIVRMLRVVGRPVRVFRCEAGKLFVKVLEPKKLNKGVPVLDAAATPVPIEGKGKPPPTEESGLVDAAAVGFELENVPEKEPLPLWVW